ncbi:hypothetical protein, partial [Campylobacter troglodytis]|uniref:hypothetical protein n=1 Tax=Campylobacter troglodytis TaxID=654363 RepID=UPI001C8D332C
MPRQITLKVNDKENKSYIITGLKDNLKLYIEKSKDNYEIINCVKAYEDGLYEFSIEDRVYEKYLFNKVFIGLSQITRGVINKASISTIDTSTATLENTSDASINTFNTSTEKSAATTNILETTNTASNTTATSIDTNSLINTTNTASNTLSKTTNTANSTQINSTNNTATTVAFINTAKNTAITNTLATSTTNNNSKEERTYN